MPYVPDPASARDVKTPSDSRDRAPRKAYPKGLREGSSPERIDKGIVFSVSGRVKRRHLYCIFYVTPQWRRTSTSRPAPPLSMEQNESSPPRR